MANFTAALLDRPAVQSAATVALAYLDDAAAAAARLDDRTDADALHDFRVALRRLRVTVRAYPGVHESVPKKQRSKLRKLARSTNAARDAEVQIAWFRDRSARFTPTERAALGPLRARLRARRRKALTDTHRAVPERFGKLERKLRRHLTELQSRAGGHEAPFRVVAVGTLVQHVAELGSRLRSASPSSAPAELHATRIAAKRLRYLLEPVRSGMPNGNRLVQRLKDLQDLLGALTDAHELELVLADGGADATTATNLLRAEVAALFTKLRDEWSTAGTARRRRSRRGLVRDLASG